MLKKVDVLIQGPSLVGENLTVPTMGRLVFGIVAIVLWFAFSWVASKAAKKGMHFASSHFPGRLPVHPVAGLCLPEAHSGGYSPIVYVLRSSLFQR